MIVETIFSTLDADGQPNFAPMGVVWGEEVLRVRPFRSTHTFRNLEASGEAVVCLTDDVLAFVQCGLYHVRLPHFPAQVVRGAVFQGACSWREVQVVEIGGGPERAEIVWRPACTSLTGRAPGRRWKGTPPSSRRPAASRKKQPFSLCAITSNRAWGRNFFWGLGLLYDPKPQKKPYLELTLLYRKDTG
jgi:hypothetical protein